jgi:hypothetical protein
MQPICHFRTDGDIGRMIRLILFCSLVNLVILSICESTDGVCGLE